MATDGRLINAKNVQVFCGFSYFSVNAMGHDGNENAKTHRNVGLRNGVARVRKIDENLLTILRVQFFFCSAYVRKLMKT